MLRQNRKCYIKVEYHERKEKCCVKVENVIKVENIIKVANVTAK